MKAIGARSTAAAAGAALFLLAAGLPAMAAPASSPPSVRYFRANVRSLSAVGGKVQLSAAVRRARFRIFSSSPRLTGLPARVSCAKGLAQRTYNGSAWTAPATIDTAGTPQAISCTVSHFCLMADLSGNVATFNGATWSATSNVDPGAIPGAGLTGVSCPNAADCVAVDWEGNALKGTG